MWKLIQIQWQHRNILEFSALHYIISIEGVVSEQETNPTFKSNEHCDWYITVTKEWNIS